MLKLRALGLADFSANSQKWDELWVASDVQQPTVRAAGVQLWHSTFSPDSRFAALVVEQGDRWVAGLPLILAASHGLSRVHLPSNHTSAAGDLLLDKSIDADQACKQIARGISKHPATIATFDDIDVESDRWRKLLGTLRLAGAELCFGRHNDVGIVDILDNWSAYQASWSRNHRSVLKRAQKKLTEQGGFDVSRIRTPTDEELYETLEQCFEVEDRSWKGDSSTSILKVPGLRAYYHRDARIMRDAGMLDLWLLKAKGKVIAFEYCHFAKGTCFSHKISFDPAWRRYSPGKLLRRFQLEQYHSDPSARLLDTLGIFCESKAKWATRTYRTSRCIVATGGLASRVALRGLKAAKRFKRLVSPNRSVGTPSPGSSGYLDKAKERKKLETPTINPTFAAFASGNEQPTR